MLEVLDEVCTPTKGTQLSACIDLYAREDITIGAGETKLVPLGVKIDLDALRKKFTEHLGSGASEADLDLALRHYKNFIKGHNIDLHIRSSLSAKHGLIIANGTGQIDLDFEDEIHICLHNPNVQQYKIKKADKVAQAKLVQHYTYLFGIETDTKRSGGFGSTGE